MYEKQSRGEEGGNAAKIWPIKLREN